MNFCNRCTSFHLACPANHLIFIRISLMSDVLFICSSRFFLRRQRLSAAKNFITKSISSMGLVMAEILIHFWSFEKWQRQHL